VQIVNMSFVGPQDPLVHGRIRDMSRRRGVVFVAAAGNGGPDAPPGYPAAYEEVIAVTAVDRKGASYDLANRGSYIDVGAPGVQIRIALPGGKEAVQSGTSFAAPFVTSVVAVAYRDADPAKVVQGSLDPKHVMLAKLLRKDQVERRSLIDGHGMIQAPAGCGQWNSIVKLAPPVKLPTKPVAAFDVWQPVVTQTSLAGASGR